VGAQVVVQNTVPETVTRAGLTGCKMQPVRIASKVKSTVGLPPLYEFVVTGKGGPMGPEAGLRSVYTCAKCGYQKYEPVYYGRSGAYPFRGLYVNGESWDGSDFFTFDGWPTILMITETARSTLVSAGLTNWRAYSVPQGAFRW
jgi:hypothetical protein